MSAAGRPNTLPAARRGKVLLLLPETPVGEQLGALACIARKLRDPAIAAALRGAPDQAAIYRALVAA
jgi:mannitol/fructose-specific phosphotransferase system IIA component (Ntr-type)